MTWYSDQQRIVRQWLQHMKILNAPTWPKDTCLEEGLNFIPLICEADGGGWGPTANAVWSELAKYKSVLTGEQNSTTATRLLKSLGLILHKENPRAILRRSPITINRDFGE